MCTLDVVALTKEADWRTFRIADAVGQHIHPTALIRFLNDFPNSTFNVMTGEYFFSVDSDHTYESRVYDDDVQTTLLGKALAKDWPVGEPAGIKIVNDDFDVKEGRATNCIMSTSYLDDHFLDTADPKQVLCSGPFQSHKRYKLAMLPSTVADGPGLEKGIDLVFNVEQDNTSRDYQVFQKINNWTDERLVGFTIQVGTGQGSSFVPASDPTAGVGVANSFGNEDTILKNNIFFQLQGGMYKYMDDDNKNLLIWKKEDLNDLNDLGVEDPLAHRAEYSTTQPLGAAAYMLDYQGLIVPSARWDCENLVLFMDRISLETQLKVTEYKEINWPAWRESHCE